MRIATLIVDDEPLARRGIALRLATHADVEIVGEAGNGRDALAAIERHRPALLYLDVQMPGIDGFGLLRSVPAALLPLTIFVTAYDAFATQAFEANALDYLLKPIDDARFVAALDRARESLRSNDANANCERLLNLLGRVSGRPGLTLDEALRGADQLAPFDEHLLVKETGRSLRIATQDILWIDAAGDYMCVHACGDTHVLRATMHELEGRLDPRLFQRIHRSTIVNVAHVAELRTHANGEYFLILDTGQELKLSRSYKDKVKLLK